VPHALADDLKAALAVPGDGLVRAALVIARLEYPRLDPAPFLDRLAALGERAAARMQGSDAATRVAGLNALLFEEEAFAGNTAQYDDPRNSCLNVVLDRRSGIPITLSVVYMDVARRAGLHLEGVNFPGHFLVRHPDERGRDLIIDPFHAGAVLSVQDCQRLLGRAREDVTFSADLLTSAPPARIATRMLTNLKRLYLGMRSFPQARAATDLLVALNPASADNIRDRGLLAYQLNDLAPALRDLQASLALAPTDRDSGSRGDQRVVWDHIKTLRKRIASLN
jgi:regulator of sirC expression with transglutaminase-like and TPR domain